MKYEEITFKDALQALLDNNGKPVDGFACKSERGPWLNRKLEGVLPNSPWPFLTNNGSFNNMSRIVPEYGELPDGTPVKSEEGEELLPVGADYRVGDIIVDNFGDRRVLAHGMFDHGDKVSYPDVSAAFRRKSPIAKGHNPDKLTKEQVGVSEGWRLLSEEEKKARCDKGFRRDIECWIGGGCPRWSNTGWEGSSWGATFRTRQPEGYFLPKSNRVAKAGEVWQMKGEWEDGDKMTYTVIVGKYISDPVHTHWSLWGNQPLRPEREISIANGDTFLAESVEEYYRQKFGKELARYCRVRIANIKDGTVGGADIDFDGVAELFPEIKQPQDFAEQQPQ